MKRQTKLITAFAAATAAFALSANAAGTIVGVTGITGHDGGNWPSYHGHLTDMVNGSNSTLIPTGDVVTSGMTLIDPADPATWTFAGNYQKTWHANSVLDPVFHVDDNPNPALNDKIGWVVMDFGSVLANLENAYLWASGGAGDAEKVNGYNLYYSSGAGIDGLPAMPTSKGKTGDYDFSSGDWTLLTAGNIGTSAGALDSTVALGGISAQYIGIEITSLHGAGSRMAIGQVEFTAAVPEPTTTALLGLGGLALIFRRRK